MEVKLYGMALIESRLREIGATKADLSKKLRLSQSTFQKKCMVPTRFTLGEVRMISVLLKFTAEEIYNSFILLDGWPAPKEDKNVDG